MGFFSDLGSFIGDVADIKNDLQSVVSDVATPIQDTASEIITLKDDLTGEVASLKDELTTLSGDVSTSVQESLQEAKNSLTPGQ